MSQNYHLTLGCLVGVAAGVVAILVGEWGMSFPLFIGGMLCGWAALKKA
jgi:hypothetical protein